VRTLQHWGLVGGLLALVACGSGSGNSNGDAPSGGTSSGGQTSSSGGSGAVSSAGDGGDGGDDTTPPGDSLWDSREVVSRLGEFEHSVRMMLVDDERLFVAGLNEVYAMPKDGGGDLLRFRASLNDLVDFRQQGSMVFVVESDGSGPDVINAVNKSDGVQTVLGQADNISAFAANDDSVFVACLGAAYGEAPSIQRFARESGEKSLFVEVADVVALGVSETDLYWVSSADGVWRRALDGATDAEQVSTELPPDQALIAFTADAPRLSWVQNGTLTDIDLLDGSSNETEYGGGEAYELVGTTDRLLWAEREPIELVLGVRSWSLESGEHVFNELPNAGTVLATDGSWLYGANDYELWRLPLSSLGE
jgi:hypothetical protein